jgi:hypothetical protein
VKALSLYPSEMVAILLTHRESGCFSDIFDEKKYTLDNHQEY